MGVSHAGDVAGGEGDEVLYLHCFRPTYGQKVVLDPKGGKDRKSEKPPVRLVTLKVDVGRPFEVICSRMDGVSGEVSTEGGSYFVRLEGAFGSGFKFSGKVELEKAFDPDVIWFSSAVYPCRCVVSKHKDIAPFLKAQVEIDRKRLQAATELTRKNHALREIEKAEKGGAEKP